MIARRIIITGELMYHPELNENIYGNFFDDHGNPTIEDDVIVEVVERQFEQHLNRLCLGNEYYSLMLKSSTDVPLTNAFK
jgi:hypothetical protein